MDLIVKKGHISKYKAPLAIIGVFEDKWQGKRQRDLDELLDGFARKAVRRGEFRGEFKETLMVQVSGMKTERILLVGLGKEKNCTLDHLRKAAAVAADFLLTRRIAEWATDLAQFKVKEATVSQRAQAVAEGFFLAGYRFDRYRTENRDRLPPSLDKIHFLVEENSEVAPTEEGISQARAVCRGVFLSRDLVNEPGNIKSPLYLAEQAQEMAREFGISCSIIRREELAREGFGALLGVAQGSEREPCLIVLEYRGGSEDEKPTALVGKGVVFDAGGISLKPAEKMDEMKMDMAGAATVIGTFAAVAGARLPVNLVGVVPAVENMPSGTAIRPGDILTSLSGRTIEVINTDAEGRLILADALTYCRRYEPRIVIDLATLTGACVIALGHHAAAVLGNDQRLTGKLLAAGLKSGERVWELPLWEEYASQLKSDVADVKNVGGRPAGTITAAAFLQKFAEEFTWAHLDIAGTAWEEKGQPWVPKGATGFGVRLLLEYLRSECRLQ